MTPNQSRGLFYSAALFNWLAAVIFLPAFGIAGKIGMVPVPSNGLFEHFGLAGIVIFGFGYWWVARDPRSHAGIVRLGILGKLVFVAITYAHFALGSANLVAAGLVTIDLIYAILFALHLKSDAAASRHTLTTHTGA